MQKILDLNGTDWIATGWQRNQWRSYTSMETGQLLNSPVPSIKSTVPGAIHADLLAAGLIEDYNVAQNSLKCEWVNNREWVMDKKFIFPSDLAGMKYILCFDGLDHSGVVYFNGKKVLDFEGMFLRHEADITGSIKPGAENTLRVIFLQSPEVDGAGWTDRIKILKSRFNYSWDWCVRLVPVGIWDDVYIKVCSCLRIRDFYPRASLKDGKITSKLDVSCDISGRYSFRYKISHDGQPVGEYAFEHALAATAAELTHEMPVKDPLAWWPNNMGAQELYDIEVTAVCLSRADGLAGAAAECDSAAKRVGFRDVIFTENVDPQPKAEPYTLVINGRRVFMQGVNWVPIKPFYGCVTRKDYENYLGRFRDMNCNMLRVWGGAILEKRDFYDVCDEMGLMVWQEFPQSSSALNNTPNVDHEFLENVLRPVAREFIVRRRHHACHAVWCAGNELTMEHVIPVDIHHANISMLKTQVDELDPGKRFLTGSPSGPSFGGRERDFGKGLHHDVHGPWFYYAHHYRYHNRDDAMLKSETGAGGCSRLETLEKYSGGLPVWPPDERNYFWKHRSSFWIELKPHTEFFGPWKDDGSELAEYVKASRYLQAEALRYLTETARRREGVMSGLFVWMGNEPFPNAANSSLVEYDGTPKPAFCWVRDCFGHARVSARYDGIAWKTGDEFKAEIFVSSDRDLADGAAVIAEIYNLRGKKLVSENWPIWPMNGKNTVQAGCALWQVAGSDAPGGVFLLRSKLHENGQTLSENTYLFTVDGATPFGAMRTMPRAKIGVTAGAGRGRIKVSNDSGAAAAGVFLYGAHAEDFADIYPNYLILLPGEMRELTVRSGSGNKARIPLVCELFNGESTRFEAES